ncbi:MAG: hypothetical protein ACKV2O_15335 [Acidimicrobiales bacterium]
MNHPHNPANPFDSDDHSADTPAQLTPLETFSDRRHARRRRGLFGLGAVGFCAAGLLVGTQLAGAGGSSDAAPAAGAANSASTDANSASAAPMGSHAGGSGWSFGANMASGGMGGVGGMFAGAGECMATELGVDISGGMGPGMFGQMQDIPQEEIEAAWETCAAELPADLTKTMEGFKACFGDMAPGAMHGEGMSGPMGAMFDGNGAVAVMTPDNHKVHSFGEGDGTITVTKTGDTYSVTNTGDVTEAEIGAMLEGMGTKMQEMMPGLQDRLQECGIELPSGMGAPAGN